ncbi:MAG: BCD family MFS transporter [Ardenticatenaceae bacterium]|nr:BCD family MFS transporter [Anaerolineales bacterium]MCB8922916.1 BCD family MFS transporter [Ardenticatenaceae bacterium]MCB8990348.1 BCD family MFS transporter [Ardenticatenaceae bacterium]MCB9005241.1 BCD family MFS transporter [Ardenticatenaceae bacterium]
MAQTSKSPFTFGRIMRLSSFQIGSAMGDILVTSIWNRVMISNFGIPAAPVSLLIALRYLLSPLSLWAGHLSDTRPFLNTRRTGYIWVGRAMMLLSLPLLALSLGQLQHTQSDFLGWAYATISSLLYGIGTLISGSPFLALVRDSAPRKKQGLAISTVETILIIFFAIVGIVFSLWMKEYDAAVFWQMVFITIGVGGFFWFFAIAGAEKRIERDRQAGLLETPTAQDRHAFMPTLKKIWQDPRTRRFFFFLAVATLSAWAQDAILEPFGAEAFHLPFDRTTRFNSYWQTATVLTLVIGSYAWRRRPPEQQASIAKWGLGIMAAGILALAAAAFFNQVHVLELALFIFGAGFGVYTFGGLSLMAVMASDKEAGAYLGLWSISVVLFKGLGTFVGGGLRDIFLLSLKLSPGLSYGLVFVLEAVGLVTAVFILSRLDVIGFARDVGRVISRTDAQISLAD